jgi:uncharacterized protein
MFDAPNSVVLQPTTLCNLDCRYCYLPLRHRNLTMSIEVALAVAASIKPWTHLRTVEVCWHGGEPLATGRARLGALFDCFAGLDVAHGVQTNGVLVDDGWCRFFAERNVHVGVSIDGTRADTAARVDRAGNPVYERIVRGIRKLQQHGIDVSIIAVVSDPTPARARRLYEFAADAGVASLGVNVEEQEGVNAASNAHDINTVTSFWTALAHAWQADPVMPIRELSRALGYADFVLRDGTGGVAEGASGGVDPLPTVGHDGSVTLISPELAGFTSPRFGDFACGNVLRSSLDDLIRSGADSAWVAEYGAGLAACRNSCAYVEFCGGGQPANRYFEQGRFDGTETNYCRNSKIALLEGVLRGGRGNDIATGADSRE